jgi:hypothetical protein
VKTRATRISDPVFFKHQYIANPQVTPETLIIKAAMDLTSALKEMISPNGKTEEVLQKFSKLFTKIAAAKSELAKAKEQWNNLQITPIPAKLYHFQGWPRDHLPQQAHF